MKTKLPFFILNKSKGLSYQEFVNAVSSYGEKCKYGDDFCVVIDNNLESIYKKFLKKANFKKEVVIAFASIPKYKDGSFTAGVSVFGADIPIILLNVNVIQRCNNRKIGLDTLKTTILHELGHVKHWPNRSEELADKYALDTLAKVNRKLFAFMINDLINMVFTGKEYKIANMYITSAKRNLKKFGIDWKAYR